MKTVSAADANRHFSSLLRDAASGEVITVLSRGKPVALISPVHSDDKQRQAAKRSLVKRLKKQAPSGSRKWTRDQLYED